MAKFFTLALLSSVISVYGAVIPRSSSPPSWSSALEDYGTYHARYMALGCENQHNSQFFADCCHPMLATECLSDLKPYCTPNSTSNSTSQSSSTENPSPSSSSTTFPPTTSHTPSPTTSHTSSPAASPTPSLASSLTSTQTQTGGFATFFYQNGVAGACGTVHSDSDLIAAIDQDRYGNSGQQSSLCGKQVRITNTLNQKTVVVTIADDCPTCNNGNSIDLSVGAFTTIATEDQGMVPIIWAFL